MCSPAILFTGWERKSYMGYAHHMKQHAVSVNRHRGMQTVDMTLRMWVENELIGPTY